MNSGFGVSQHNFGGEENEHVKRQLDLISQKLDDEKSVVASEISKQAEELDQCRTEIMQYNDEEQKLKTRVKELESELQRTLDKIDQLQRGVSGTRRRSFNASGSRGASPYTRNSSGSKGVPS